MYELVPAFPFIVMPKARPGQAEALHEEDRERRRGHDADLSNQGGGDWPGPTGTVHHRRRHVVTCKLADATSNVY
jgi:hypothetical protein